MNKRNFTLVELLVVIGILAILAGLIIPAVISAKQKGRITTARADMDSIRTAFAGLNKDYHRMAAKDGTSYKLGGHPFSVADGCITIGDNLDYYCDVIAELGGQEKVTPSLNKRRNKYLDPKPEYDPSKDPTNADNKKNTWLDPWGNPYRIRVNVDTTEKIPDPSKSGKTLSAPVIVWSLGPDGKGSDTADAEDNKDNIASWKEGNWLD